MLMIVKGNFKYDFKCMTISFLQHEIIFLGLMYQRLFWQIRRNYNKESVRNIREEFISVRLIYEEK